MAKDELNKLYLKERNLCIAKGGEFDPEIKAIFQKFKKGGKLKAIDMKSNDA